MKTKYEIKDRVWIHIGERTLTEGRVVEIIDLAHLEEGHDPEQELYIIELKTGIDDVYEVRSADMISEDASGPIGVFRREDHRESNRLTKKLGMPVPDGVMEFDEYPEPTPEQIHAAIDRSQELNKHDPLPRDKRPPAKKKYYRKPKPKA
jgi:predicted RecB family endonuclease